MTFDFDLDLLAQAVGRFAGTKVLVLGDIMLDQFIWGKVSRISPEAPVPVVDVERETYMLGGAANVVHNLTALGADTLICGLVGEDSAGVQTSELLDELDVPTEGLIRSSSRPTTLKTRVVAHSQQVVRVDREKRVPANAGELAQMAGFLARRAKDCRAVVVSDYAKGVICAETLREVMPLAARGIVVAVDPKVANMHLYRGATVITPNHHEALAAARVAPDTEDGVTLAGRRLLEELNTANVLVTQGERGMTLFNAMGEDHIPTMAKKVFDVTGAGDTVISTLSLGLAVGLSPREAAVLANFAAGEVVGEVGTSIVTAGRLVQAVEEGARRLGRNA